MCCKGPPVYLLVGDGGGRGPSDRLIAVVMSLSSGDPSSSDLLGVLQCK